MTKASSISTLVGIVLLVAAGCNSFISFEEAVWKADMRAIKRHIKAGANLDRGLQFAAGAGNLEVCKFLVESGADINASDSHDLPFTPLMAASAEGWLDVCTWLVSQGALINVTRPGRLLPIQSAVKSDRPKILQLLIDNGADTKVLTDSGHSLQMIADMYQSHEAANVLKQHYSKLDPFSYGIANGQVTLNGWNLVQNEVQIPSTIEELPVTSIGKLAFSGSRSLESVTIPEGVTSIGLRAFIGCNKLTAITIPDSVTSIQAMAFFGCSNLTSITIPQAFHSEAEARRLGLDKLWPDGFLLPASTVLSSSVRAGTLGALNYEIADGLVTITDCDGAAEGEMVIPDEIDGLPVTRIGERAFEDCSSLTSIIIPEGITSIEWWAFQACSSLTSISVTSGNSSYKSLDGIVFSKDLNQLLICPEGKSGDYIIPEGVTSIGGAAFAGCKSLTTITIPKGVTSIGSGAFQICSNLTSVTISDSVTTIDSYAFRECRSLTSITIPDSVTNIGNGAFQFCSNLTSVTISDSVTTIDSYAFRECRSLTSITIPDSVTSIGGGAFRDCSSLNSITIPDSVTSIGYFAFADCSSLTSVTIPDSVTSIMRGSLYGCSSLTSIIIPQAFHSEDEARRLGLDELWPEGFSLPNSRSHSPD